MSFHSWLQNLRSTLAPSRRDRQNGSARVATHRPSLEVLEDRSVPAFIAAGDYGVASHPIDVAAGDFNNDGIPDLATANLDSSTVSVLLGNGDGTFQPARNTFTYPPYSLAVGDFNEDGNLDIATGNAVYGIDPSVNVLLGRGDGTFVHANFPTVNGVATDIATGDLNGDGKLDLVTTLEDPGPGTGDYVTVLLGHGDGTFAPALYGGPYESGLTSLALDDFNGDGNTDVVVAGFLESAMILTGNGDGTLQPPRALGVIATHLAVGDVDGDERLDLAATAGELVRDVRILRGNGDGTFQPAQSFAAGDSPTSIQAADVSGDGVLDLVTINYGNVDGHVTVLLGGGDGSFGSSITTAAGPSLMSLVVADFDADGRPDAAVTSYELSTVSVFINDGAWDGSPPPPPPLPSITVDAVAISEGNTGTTSATFTVTLSATSAQPVTVQYATANGSATAGGDYQAASGTLTFAPGEISKTVTVQVNGDRLAEPNETFVLNLSAPTNATIPGGQGVGTILDDEPRISIGDVTKKEGNGKKSTLFIFTVTLSAPYDEPVTMSFQTVNGTSTTGDNDYVAKSGTLTFAPGETIKTITIEVKGDRKREADETFYLDLLDNSSNSLFARSRGVGSIQNDD